MHLPVSWDDLGGSEIIRESLWAQNPELSMCRGAEPTTVLGERFPEVLCWTTLQTNLLSCHVAYFKVGHSKYTPWWMFSMNIIQWFLTINSRDGDHRSRWRRETIPGRRNCICKGPEAWQRTVYGSSGKFFVAAIQGSISWRVSQGLLIVRDEAGSGFEGEGERLWSRSV